MSASSFPEAFYQAFNTLSVEALFFWLFVIFAFGIYIAYIIRMWLVQSATFEIRDYLANLNDHFIGAVNDESTLDENENTERLRNYVSEEQRRAEVDAALERLKPRRAFVWAAAGIPVLLIILIVMMTLI